MNFSLFDWNDRRALNDSDLSFSCAAGAQREPGPARIETSRFSSIVSLPARLETGVLWNH